MSLGALLLLHSGMGTGSTSIELWDMQGEAPENNGKEEQVPSYDDIRNVLYNIAEEKENLYEAEPEVAAELEAKLEEYITALPDGFYPPKDPAGRPENFGAVWTAGWC